MPGTHRIVSLIASATEIVAALGAEPQLVGRSHECDYPPPVCDLPACSDSRVDVSASSGEIDRQVKNALQEGLSVYQVFEDVLEQLEPTVIITQTMCDVCAVSLKDVEEAICERFETSPELVVLEPMCLADIWTDIAKVGQAIGAIQEADALIKASQDRLRKLEELTRHQKHHPRVACIEWLDPLMCAGNWVPELVQISGGQNLFGTAGEHSPWMNWDELKAADPEQIVILPCGWDIPRVREEMNCLSRFPQWQQLTAVQNGQVFVTDGNQYFNRPGPRVVESAEILAEIFYPGEYDFGHHGTAWEYYS